MKKEHSDRLRHYIINTVIPQLEANGLPGINVIIAGVAGSLMGTTTIGNYAEVLKQTLTQNAVDFTKKDLNRVQARKRQHIIPMYAREEIINQIHRFHELSHVLQLLKRFQLRMHQ